MRRSALTLSWLMPLPAPLHCRASLWWLWFWLCAFVTAEWASCTTPGSSTCVNEWANESAGLACTKAYVDQTGAFTCVFYIPSGCTLLSLVMVHLQRRQRAWAIGHTCRTHLAACVCSLGLPLAAGALMASLLLVQLWRPCCTQVPTSRRTSALARWVAEALVCRVCDGFHV
jgi:hypothetical protein